MTSPSRTCGGLVAAGLLALSIANAQPPIPGPPGGQGGGAPPPAEKIAEAFAKVRDEAVAALAYMPDDVLGAALKCSQHPDYLVAMKPHPTDTEFNEAASYLYREQPELFTMMRENPLTTAMLGQQAKADPQQMWQTIDQARQSGGLNPPMAGGAAQGAAPELKLDTGELNKSIDGMSSSVSDVSKSMNSSTKELKELNREIDDAQTKADKTKDKIEDEDTVDEVGEKVEKKIAEKTGGTNPFGGTGDSTVVVAGFGMVPAGRSGGQAWNSTNVSSAVLQQQMGRGNGAAAQSFGRSEMALQKRGGGGGAGMPRTGGGGGARPGGRPGGRP